MKTPEQVAAGIVYQNGGHGLEAFANIVRAVEKDRAERFDDLTNSITHDGLVEVATYISDRDGATVYELNTNEPTHMRILLNDAVLFDQDTDHQADPGEINEAIYDTLANRDRSLADEFANRMDRLAALEEMIREVAAMSEWEDSDVFQVDDVGVDDQGRPAVIFGTRINMGFDQLAETIAPYIIGES